MVPYPDPREPVEVEGNGWPSLVNPFNGTGSSPGRGWATSVLVLIASSTGRKGNVAASYTRQTDNNREKRVRVY